MICDLFTEFPAQCSVLSIGNGVSRFALNTCVLVFFHELGHFLVAKACGVKCEKFYVGFDVPIRIGPIKFPRTLGKFRYGRKQVAQAGSGSRHDFRRFTVSLETLGEFRYEYMLNCRCLRRRPRVHEFVTIAGCQGHVKLTELAQRTTSW